MPRAKRGTKARSRRKKVLKAAEGYYGGRSRLFRTAKEAVDRAGIYAYAHRKLKKRNFRTLWNTRIGAAAKAEGYSYSRLISALKGKGVGLNRKMLSELAITHPKDFVELLTFVRK